VNAAETHETFRLESGMRYQLEVPRPDSCSESGFRVPTHGGVDPYCDSPPPVGSTQQLGGKSRRVVLERSGPVTPEAIRGDGRAGWATRRLMAGSLNRLRPSAVGESKGDESD
jgi:hypothetical protein